jgi:hypothetical protein
MGKNTSVTIDPNDPPAPTQPPGGGCEGVVCRRPPKTPSKTVKATKDIKAAKTAKTAKAKVTKATNDTTSDDEEWLPEKTCNRKTCRETANYTWRKNHCGLKKNQCDKGRDTVWLNGDCHENATVENDADDADGADDSDPGWEVVDEVNENDFCTNPKVALEWMRKKGIKSKIASLNILTACTSKTYDITVADASMRWIQEIEVMKSINKKVNKFAKSEERHVKGAFFALCVLHYLVFGIHFDNHEKTGEIDASCPYGDDAKNFIITLVKSNKCLCRCYTQYVLAACEEFDYDDCVVAQYFLGHVNIAVIFPEHYMTINSYKQLDIIDEREKSSAASRIDIEAALDKLNNTNDNLDIPVYKVFLNLESGYRNNNKIVIEYRTDLDLEGEYKQFNLLVGKLQDQRYAWYIFPGALLRKSPSHFIQFMLIEYANRTKKTVDKFVHDMECLGLVLGVDLEDFRDEYHRTIELRLAYGDHYDQRIRRTREEYRKGDVSLGTLKSVIDKMDSGIIAKFDQNADKISGKFKEYFKKNSIHIPTTFLYEMKYRVIDLMIKGNKTFIKGFPVEEMKKVKKHIKAGTRFGSTATVENDADGADDSHPEVTENKASFKGPPQNRTNETTKATKATRGRITSNASCSGKGTCFDQFMFEDEDLQTYMANDADNMVIFVEEADRRAAYCTSVQQIKSLGVMKTQNTFYECETLTRRGKVSHGRSNRPPLARIPLTYGRFVERESLKKLLKREVRYITLRRIGHTDRLMSTDVFGAKVGAGISGMHCQETSEDIWEAVEADRSC